MYPLFRAVMTGWDNTPRRQRRGYVFLGATPERYGEWLAEAVRQTRERHPSDRPLVFINAWNEWAEGAHLEPDQRYKRAYLEATQEAMRRSTSSGGSLKPASPALVASEAIALQRVDELFAQEELEIRRHASALVGHESRIEEQRVRLTALHNLRTDAIRILGEEIRRAVENGPAPALHEIGPVTLEITVRLSRGLDRVPAVKSALRAMIRKMLRSPNPRP